MREDNRRSVLIEAICTVPAVSVAVLAPTDGDWKSIAYAADVSSAVDFPG